MSIAVSALILPSRRLWRLHALLHLLVLLAAACAPDAALRLALAAAAALAACRAHGLVNLARLDISGVGAMRLAVYPLLAARAPATRGTAPAVHAAARAPPDAWAGQAREVRLLPGSTLWPGLMLLRLRGDDGAVQWLAVLPDSVGAEAWRRLALAVRAVAAQAPAAHGTG
ncbi:protein YgfX [[Empedobacter] haloabium]|uniref:Protein YgfX n=1 Tax=[Empedobacter] haloabium TaxID=592317 RepID=A0ABZ1UH25_9BURK